MHNNTGVMSLSFLSQAFFTLVSPTALFFCDGDSYLQSKFLDQVSKSMLNKHFPCSFCLNPLITRLMLFIIASSSATLTWVLSSFFRSQVASSTATSCITPYYHLMVPFYMPFSFYIVHFFYFCNDLLFHEQHFLINCIIPTVCTHLPFNKTTRSSQPSNYRVMANQLSTYREKLSLDQAILGFGNLVFLSKHLLSSLIAL